MMRQRITKSFKPFKKGDHVWLDNCNLKIPYPHWKLAPKYKGPFLITEVLNPLNYRLKLLNMWKIHPIFHATFLMLYHKMDTHGLNYSRPPPDLIEENEDEVKAILAHKVIHGTWRYLIKWRGYVSAENSWELAQHLVLNAADLLAAYKKAKKLH